MMKSQVKVVIRLKYKDWNLLFLSTLSLWTWGYGHGEQSTMIDDSTKTHYIFSALLITSFWYFRTDRSLWCNQLPTCKLVHALILLKYLIGQTWFLRRHQELHHSRQRRKVRGRLLAISWLRMLHAISTLNGLLCLFTCRNVFGFISSFIGSWKFTPSFKFLVSMHTLPRILKTVYFRSHL